MLLQTQELTQSALGQTLKLYFLYHLNLPHQLALGNSCVENPVIQQEGMFLLLQLCPPKPLLSTLRTSTLVSAPCTDALRQSSGNQYPNKERGEPKGQPQEEVKDQGSFSSTSLSFIRFGTVCQRQSIIKTEGQAILREQRIKNRPDVRGRVTANPSGRSSTFEETALGIRF